MYMILIFIQFYLFHYQYLWFLRGSYVQVGTTNKKKEEKLVNLF